MKKYYKNNKEVPKPRLIIHNRKTYINPNDNLLIEAGYEIVNDDDKKPTNEDIKKARALAYKLHADQYFIAYQAYKDLEQWDKAEEMRALWIKVRDRIDEMNPYTEE